MRARAALLPIALLLLAAPLQAQTVNIAADLPVASPSGGGVRNLTFGTVTIMAGQTQNIDVNAAVAPASGTVQSGAFRFGVTGSRGVEFTMGLPTQLTRPGAPPLPLSFNGTQFGGYCVTSTATCTLTAFNPTAATTRVCAQTLGNGNCHPNRTYGAGQQLAVYVGGRLVLPPTASAGLYTATVTLTITQVY